MSGLNKIEEFLIDLKVGYEEVSENTYILRDGAKGLTNVIVVYDDPVVVMRTKVMDLPIAKREALFEALLRLNGTDILHGAYGIEGNEVILSDTLEYATMDKEEFEASIDAIGLALSQHYPILSGYRN
jgi:hypothetical protein